MRGTQFTSRSRRLAAFAIASSLAVDAHGAVPGITGPAFNLQAAPGYTAQPDGTNVYTWGYGCDGARRASRPTGSPAACRPMQLPGPTLIVTAGQSVSVTLTNNLPVAAGNTSILFPGFTCSGAAHRPVRHAGRRPADHRGRPRLRGDLHVHRQPARHPRLLQRHAGRPAGRDGPFGALIVLPSLSGGVPAGYTTPSGHPVTCRPLGDGRRRPAEPKVDFRLAAAAYDHPSACYDREYMFQLSSMDLAIHEARRSGRRTWACTQPAGCMVVPPSRTARLLHGQWPLLPRTWSTRTTRGLPARSRTTATRTCTRASSAAPRRRARRLAAHAARARQPRPRPGARREHAAEPLGQARRPAAVHDDLDAGPGDGRHLPVDVEGPELGRLRRTPTAITTDVCSPDANGYYTTRAARPRRRRTTTSGAPTTEGARVQALRARRLRRPRHAARPEHRRHGPVVRRQPLLRGRRHCARMGATPIPPSGTVGNDPGSEAGIRVHVALAQRARDHDQQHVPGRHDDDDAGRPVGCSQSMNPIRGNGDGPQLGAKLIKAGYVGVRLSCARAGAFAQSTVTLDAHHDHDPARRAGCADVGIRLRGRLSGNSP